MFGVIESDAGKLSNYFYVVASRFVSSQVIIEFFFLPNFEKIPVEPGEFPFRNFDEVNNFLQPLPDGVMLPFLQKGDAYILFWDGLGLGNKSFLSNFF